ncbi:PDZ domain-containing protein [Dyadobacter sp. LHD-138]|uniref:S41 family peptidase n=1 Tax=Dyadobacter sp. LHD-138 TaxID=3071413 RepID=UPI0027E1F2CB|nr:PDZ domain-containing protein [Dyadobacter sp. LHD-138]MDQ6480389.1 PDZ domain-containing protein [Dyadobacter sp. LHD-138]
MKKRYSFLFLLGLLQTGANAQETRLLRFPAVHGNQVVFSYAGDLYTVPKSGGVSRKITNHPGYETFPRFSHDGKQIAFTGQYDGNTEVFVIPATGGEPKRITYTATLGRDDVADRMGPNNVVMGWTPDDKNVVYRSRGTSFNAFKGKLYKAPISGDLSEELPFSVAGWSSYNEDGSKLAMNRVFREFRTWKYYKGGMADEIWIFDVKTGKTENVTNNPAQDIFPMYYKNKVYFLSDRDRTMNLFEYDTQSKQTKKITDFKEFDCKFPSLGDNAIAFENAGYIYLYDLITGKTEKLSITVSEDFSSGRNKQVDAAKMIDSYAISPDGKRAALGARGDVFSVPAKNGVTRNLTQSSSAHDRNVEWSPDGKWLSYLSDRSGEDELYIQKQDGSEPAKQLTKGGGSYKFNPVWSPDSKYLLLADRSQDLYYVETATGNKTLITHSDSREIDEYTFAPDSKWIAYTEPGKARAFDVIKLYQIGSKKMVQVTDGWYNSNQPKFSPDGKLLYFVSARDFNPTYSNTEWNHAYSNMEKPYYVRLAADAKSSFQLENDEVTVKTDSAAVSKPEIKDSKNKKEVAKKDAPKADEIVVKVDEENLADRIESLPVAAGNYNNLSAANEGVYYTSSTAGKDRSLKYFGLKDKKENEIGDIGGYVISADTKKILFRKMADWYIEDLGTSKIEPKNKLTLDGLKFNTDVRAEWKQIYDESWRQMRDYFYDPNMHGVNWKAMHDKYAALLPYVNHRNDLTYLIGELIGELNIGHAYTNPGDRPEIERVKMGLLGATFSRDKSGYYKIETILSGQSWNKSLVSPLRAPGVKVKTGDYIISINGNNVKNFTNLYQGLIGKAGQTIEMEVNNVASDKGRHKIIVKPIADEADLYYHQWVQNNIARVEKASRGKVGYVHIPDMGPDGLNQFARYFYPQLDKEALIIDDRGNGGGNVSPMTIERLRRQPGLGAMMRNSKSAVVKPDAQIGPKICLIDQYSASDGDLFPYQFRFYNIGQLVGQRTWGGVVGIRGSLPFIDGSDLRKPEFAHFAADGSKFIIEGEGVSPDIEVVNDPHQEYLGNDVQLDRAIDEMKKKIAGQGQKGVPNIPKFPNKSGN